MVIKLVWTSKIMFLLMSCPSDRTWRPQLYTNQGSFAFYPMPAWKQVKICHNGYRMHSHGHWGQCQGHEEELHVSSRMSYDRMINLWPFDRFIRHSADIWYCDYLGTRKMISRWVMTPWLKALTNLPGHGCLLKVPFSVYSVLLSEISMATG